jgi:hypothetical protein
MIVIDVINQHHALLVSLLALVVSMLAKRTSSKAYSLNLRIKEDADRLKFQEKKQAVLNEVDRQNAKLNTLSMAIAQKLLLYKTHPELHDSMAIEFERLRSNLEVVARFSAQYDLQRSGVDEIAYGTDPAMLEELVGKVRQLSIQVDKDISHEQEHLKQMRSTLDK